jgi:hypothetical protein
MEGRPPRLDDPAYSAITTRFRAGFGLAIVDFEAVLKVAEAAIRLAVVAKR